MVERLTIPASQAQVLPPKRHQDTQTPWEDPWTATEEAREQLASTATPYSQESIRRQAPDMGQQITDEINSDPAEVERLRAARRSARAGRIYPRHSDTSSD